MTSDDLKARTALAADLARINRQRFNEAVAENFYPCAPPTIRGATRLFDVEDIVALRIYGRLLDEGVVPRSAGSIACGLRELLRRFPGLDRAIHVTVSITSPIWFPPEESPGEALYLNGGEIISIREWRLTSTRDRIVQELQKAAKSPTNE